VASCKHGVSGKSTWGLRALHQVRFTPSRAEVAFDSKTLITTVPAAMPSEVHYSVDRMVVTD
jgi:hypothetical protein